MSDEGDSTLINTLKTMDFGRAMLQSCENIPLISYDVFMINQLRDSMN